MMLASAIAYMSSMCSVDYVDTKVVGSGGSSIECIGRDIRRLLISPFSIPHIWLGCSRLLAGVLVKKTPVLKKYRGFQGRCSALSGASLT